MKSVSKLILLSAFLSLVSTAWAGTSSNLVSNPTFSGGVVPTNWVSSFGWQACSGNSGSQPCVNASSQVQFSYPSNTSVTQSNIALPSSIPDGSILSFSIEHDAGWFSDASQITLSIYDASNNLLASESSSCSQPCTDPSMRVTITDPATLAAASTATVSFSDTSGNPWAGNYGAIFYNPQLVLSWPDQIPTLGEWSMILLTLLMVLFASVMLQRIQRKSSK